MRERERESAHERTKKWKIYYSRTSCA